VDEEWRVSIALDEVPRAERKSRMRSLVTALRARLGDQASISGGNERVFIYTSTAESAAALAQEARDVLVQQAVASPEWVSVEVWLPTTERWRDGTDVPPARIARSYENADKYQQAKEAERSVATGIPAWRVKITLRSGHEAKAVREYLTDRGLRIRASRTRLFTWVNCEDDAHALSAALTGAGLMTPGTRIEIEPQKPVLSRGSGFSLFDLLPP
jgi:hypothetical protein